MNLSTEAFEILYTEPAGELGDMAVEALRHRQVNNYRVKTVKAGEQLEVFCFPILNQLLDAKQAKAAAKEARSTPAQQKLNEKNASRKIARLANANFGDQDIPMTLTYDLNERPADHEQAHRDVVNFLKRVKYFRKKRGLSELKALYTEEWTNGKYGINYNHHMIISGEGVTREEMEALWPYGNVRDKRYRDQPAGYTGFAFYMTENKKSRRTPQNRVLKRRWSCTKNLVDPDEHATRADKKLSKAQMATVAAAAHICAAAVFEKLYPGYQLIDCEVSRSPITPGAFVYARMRKKTDPPKRKGRAKRRTMNEPSPTPNL